MRAAILGPGLVLAAIVAMADAQRSPEPDAAAGAELDPGAGVVATVNGEPIYFEDVERRLRDLHRGRGEARREAYDLDQLMFRLINDTLLAQEARILGMDEEEPIPGKLENLRRGLAVKVLESEEIWKDAEPTEEEVRAAFESDYRTVTLRIITSRERPESEALLAEIEGGADFETLAREHSVDGYGPRGGLVKDLPRAKLPPEIAEAAFGSTPGSVEGPIRTGLGWALIRIDSVAAADPESFEQLESELRDIVRLRKAEALRVDLGERLRELHPIAIHPEVVDAIASKRLPDGRLAPEVEDPEAVVARIGERTLSAGDLGRALAGRWQGVRNQEAALAAKPLVLDRLVREELMVAEALRRGYGELPKVRRTLRAFETQQLVPRMLTEVIAAGVEVEPQEVKSYFEENREAFRKPPRVHLGQITVATEEEAERLAELLRQGADFAWLARQHSIDGLRDAGGDKGWMIAPPGGNDLQRRLFDAKTGEVMGPMGEPGEFVILQVDAREEQGYYSLEEATPRARSAVLRRKFQVALDDTIQTLRSQSEISIDHEVLDSMQITGGQTEPRHGH